MSPGVLIKSGVLFARIWYGVNNLPAEELFVLSFEPGITPPLVPTPPDNDVIFDPGKVVPALLGLPEFPRSCKKKRLGNSGYKRSWESDGPTFIGPFSPVI